MRLLASARCSLAETKPPILHCRFTWLNNYHNFNGLPKLAAYDYSQVL